MAQAAEEYGSHDKTFEIDGAGHGARGRRGRRDAARARRSSRATSGACARPRTPRSRTGSRLAVSRARATGAPAVFWLDETRAHDAELLRKVRPALDELDTERPPDRDHGRRRARRGSRSSARARGRGHDLGHRQRAARLPDRPVPDPRARHQREDAVDRAADGRRRPVRDRRRRLGAEARPAVPARRTTCAGTRSASSSRSARRSSCWPTRTRQPARAGCSPTRSTGRPAACSRRTARRRARSGELDNRGSHFYLALYWAQELAGQDEDAELAERFAPLAERLASDEQQIVEELDAVQGSPVEIGGYYLPDPERMAAAMRPSATFNEALERCSGAGLQLDAVDVAELAASGSATNGPTAIGAPTTRCEQLGASRTSSRGGGRARAAIRAVAELARGELVVEIGDVDRARAPTAGRRSGSRARRSGSSRSRPIDQCTSWSTPSRVVGDVEPEVLLEARVPRLGQVARSRAGPRSAPARARTAARCAGRTSPRRPRRG